MKNKFNCTGCSACAYICSHNAIIMTENEDGFIYPQIDEDKCVECGLCEYICNKENEYSSPILSVCVQNCDSNQLSKATSGGIISAIADYILEKNGCVFSTQYTSVQDGPKWTIIDSREKFSSVQGSKYFQIPLTPENIQAIRSRCDKQTVLFIGTPCQVSGIKKVVKSSNLITIDLICGGIASYKLEKAYIHYWDKKTSKKVVCHSFRSKSQGWTKNYVAEIHFNDGKVIEKIGFDDLFNRLYNSGNCNRESCYNCEFSKIERVGDFTAGDAWGIQGQKTDGINIKQGVSLLLVNTKKAKNIFNEIDNISYIPASNKVIFDNKPLRLHSKRRYMRNISYFIAGHFNLRIAANIINYRYLIKRVVRKIK
jgi:coenzyme F420-reducing hydrogenase beta subunit